MAAVELTADEWEPSDGQQTAPSALPDRPPLLFGQAFKAQLSIGDGGLSLDVENCSAGMPSGECWSIGIAELVEGWIEEAGEDETGLADLDCLSAHLEEQAARLRAIVTRHALAGRSFSISGRRVPYRPKLVGTPTA